MDNLLVILLLLALGSGKGSSGGSGGKTRPRPKGLKPQGSVPRPPGHPPPFGGLCEEGAYDFSFWPTVESVKERFAQLGYPVPAGRPTMNALGPDGSIGGGDDVPSQSVLEFQTEYNLASAGGFLGPDAGGLDMDGYVGACTLNGMQLVLEVFGTGPVWRGTAG